MSFVCSFSAVQCENLNGYHCQCYNCQQELISSFHVAYFVHFGLKFEEFEKRGDKYLYHITSNVIAKAFEIMEKRSQKIFAVQKLESLCLYELSKIQFHLSDAVMPTKIRAQLHNFDGAFDVFEKLLAETPGNTIFRPFNFPKFLFRHKYMYLSGFDPSELL